MARLPASPISKEAPPAYGVLLPVVWAAVGGPQARAAIIGVDGHDGSGTTALATWLAWQIEGSILHVDDYRTGSGDTLEWRADELARVIEARLSGGKTVIVEGRFLLRTLRAIDREPDFLVLVEHQDVTGSRDVGAEISRYVEEQQPRERADFVLFASRAAHDARLRQDTLHPD